MSPDGQTQRAPVTLADSTMVLGALSMADGVSFSAHVHDHHQIAWTPTGVLTVRISDQQWVLPPTRALWIPAGTAHETGTLRGADMRAIFVDSTAPQKRWSNPVQLAVSPLLHLLFDHLTYVTAHDVDARRRTEAVTFDLLEPVEVTGLTLTWPRRAAARAIAAAVARDPGDQRTLGQHAASVGTSARTVARAIMSETGITFGRWRTHARLAASLRLLADGMAVGRIAERVGYATPSAYIAAFRRELGIAPGDYFSVIDRND